MPMIDIYAATGTFADRHRLAIDAASTVMRVEQVPDIPVFRKNTAAIVHELAPDSLANVDGDSSYVRVQVPTNAGALDRDKQLTVVRELTDLVATAAADPTLTDRTWCSSRKRPKAVGVCTATPRPTPSWWQLPAPRSHSFRPTIHPLMLRPWSLSRFSFDRRGSGGLPL